MSEKKPYQDLFGQYAAEAGNYLPRRKRKDIQLEILSLLEDSIDDRSEEVGRAPDEEMAIEVLKKLGPPITFAQNYQPSTALIGPDIFPLFRWGLIFAAVVFLLQFVIGLFVGGASGEGFLDVLDSFLDKGFQVFGLLVFVFAILERTTPTSWLHWPFREMERSWDPAGLKDKQKSVVKPGELWVGNLFLVGALILFGVFPQWVGFGMNRDGVWYFVPVLSEAFSVYLPWVLAYFVVEIGFNFVLARQAYWDARMRWVSIGVKVFKIGLLIAFLTGPDVFGLNPAYLAYHDPSPQMVDWFTSTLRIWNTVLQIVFIMRLLGEIVGVIVTLVKLARTKSGLELPEIG